MSCNFYQVAQRPRPVTSTGEINDQTTSRNFYQGDWRVHLATFTMEIRGHIP